MPTGTTDRQGKAKGEEDKPHSLPPKTDSRTLKDAGKNKKTSAPKKRQIPQKHMINRTPREDRSSGARPPGTGTCAPPPQHLQQTGPEGGPRTLAGLLNAPVDRSKRKPLLLEELVPQITFFRQNFHGSQMYTNR